MARHQICQTCTLEGRFLEYSSQGAKVDYYRCAQGHVWHVTKDDPNAGQTIVTDRTVTPPRVTPPIPRIT